MCRILGAEQRMLREDPDADQVRRLVVGAGDHLMRSIGAASASQAARAAMSAAVSGQRPPTREEHDRAVFDWIPSPRRGLGDPAARRGDWRGEDEPGEHSGAHAQG
ncbi:unnamed protein product [Ostreobium quekettii]|uniref:Uncharacterized protein n=1 Tax=Ostreobium quekettii TaxID=121088 RepID=A0A8S1J779_9CHLO|nr:unnamed protein product [Ostreobium quekettii]